MPKPKQLKSIDSHRLLWPCIVALCLLAPYGWCQDPYRIESYHYNPAGRVDPFKPLVKIETLKKNASAVKLSPLQRYDISQLKLVGIAGTGKKKLAMVLDTKGKSYVVSPGTIMGLNGGRVVQILDDQIVIEEKKQDDSKKTDRLTLKLYHYEDNP